MVKNKRIFITGGANGLGKAIAKHYAKQGFKVAIGDINKENLAQTKAELLALCENVLTVHCNTTKLTDLEKARKTIEDQWGGLDILVNNAGIAGTIDQIDTVSMADWDQVLDVNLLGVVRGCKVFTSLFKRQGSGVIVNIASMAGLQTPPSMSIYNTSKASVIALTETLRFELTPHNINVHVVCPAFFKTNLCDSMNASSKAKNFLETAMEKSSLTAEDIAAMIGKQVEKNELYLMPHKRERNLWRFKRFFPSWYERSLMKVFMKMFGQ